MDIGFNQSISKNPNEMIVMNAFPQFYESLPSFSHPALSSVANAYFGEESGMAAPTNGYLFRQQVSFATSSSHGGSEHQRVIQSGEEQLAHKNSDGKSHSMAAMREMIFRIAAMQPINIDPETVKLPKRRNVKISKDPQSVAARHRREKISERIRILQRLVPGGTKMDTGSMLDEAIHYVKFLKNQVETLEHSNASSSDVLSSSSSPSSSYGVGFPSAMGLPSLTKGLFGNSEDS